ncbi:hypothetical protein CULT_1490002 [[Clostridium] ultunense Esp]|nr:hypothetical protein CULT_1490002 [[Clostridium] ultunense Esp]
MLIKIKNPAFSKRVMYPYQLSCVYLHDIRTAWIYVNSLDKNLGFFVVIRHP